MASIWVEENTKLFLALTKRGFHPMGKYTYLQDLVSCVVKPTLTTHGVAWHLVTINVPKLVRGYGLATIAMEGIIDAANECQRLLVLEVAPDNENDTPWLVAWYSRLGFQSVDDILMIRYPTVDNVLA